MERGEITKVLQRARALRVPSVSSWSVEQGTAIVRDAVPYRIRSVVGLDSVNEQVLVIIPPPSKPEESAPKRKKRSWLQRLLGAIPSSTAGVKPPTSRPADPPETVEVYNGGWLVDGPWQEDIPRILAALNRDCDRARLEQIERAKKAVAR